MLTLLQLSLLSTTVGIITWLKPVENGGFLNYAFEFIDDSAGGYFQGTADWKDFYASLKIIKQFALGTNLRYAVLRALPVSFGGGDANVNAAQTNVVPTLVVIGLSLTVAILIIICLILTLILFCCCGYALDNKYVEDTGSYLSGKDSTESLKVDKKTCRRLIYTLIKKHKFSNNCTRGCYLFSFTLTIITFVALFILIACLFSSQNLILSDYKIIHGTVHVITSLTSGIKSAFYGIDNFLETGLSSGQPIMHDFVLEAQNLTQRSLSPVLQNYPNSLIEVFNSMALNKVFIENGAASIQLIKNITLIDTTDGGLSVTIHKFSASLSDVLARLNELVEEICQPQTELCVQLLKESNAITIDLPPGKCETDYLIPIAQLETPYAKSVNIANEQLTQFTVELETYSTNNNDKLLTKLGISHQFSFLNKVWGDFKFAMHQPISNIKEIGLNVYQQVTGLWNTIKMIISTVLAIAVLPTFIAMLGFLVFTVHRFRKKKRSLEITETGKMDFSRRKDICSCVFCCSSILLVLHVVIFGFIGIILLVGSSIVANLGCIYISTNDGLLKTNYIVDNMTAHRWQTFSNKFLPTGPDFADGFIDFPAPKNLFKSLWTGCQSAEAGFLKEIGWKNIVNMQNLFKSEQMQSNLRNTNKYLFATTKKIVEIYPKFEIFTQIISSENTVSFALLAYDVEECNKLYSTNLIPEQKILSVENLLIDYISTVNDFDSKDKLTEQLNLLTDLSQQIHLINDAIKKENGILQIVNNGKLSIMKVGEAAVAGNTIAKKISDGSMNEIIVSHCQEVLSSVQPAVQSKLEILSSNLTNELFQCGNLHETIETTEQVTCDHHGIVGRLLAAAYILLLLTLFTFILFIDLTCLFYFSSFREIPIDSETNTTSIYIF